VRLRVSVCLWRRGREGGAETADLGRPACRWVCSDGFCRWAARGHPQAGACGWHPGASPLGLFRHFWRWAGGEQGKEGYATCLCLPDSQMGLFRRFLMADSALSPSAFASAPKPLRRRSKRLWRVGDWRLIAPPAGREWVCSDPSTGSGRAVSAGGPPKDTHKQELVGGTPRVGPLGLFRRFLLRQVGRGRGRRLRPARRGSLAEELGPEVLGAPFGSGLDVAEVAASILHLPGEAWRLLPPALHCVWQDTTRSQK